MIKKISTRNQELSEKIMYYGKSKICKKVHLCQHLVANISFQLGGLWPNPSFILTLTNSISGEEGEGKLEGEKCRLS